VVAGEEAGSKLATAEKLGVTVVDEAGLMELLRE
jgi:DNA ligase (NAD+)